MWLIETDVFQIPQLHKHFNLVRHFMTGRKNFKRMKSLLSLLFISIVIHSCKKTDKSMFNSPCTDSCTIVQGRFITGNNEGVANIPIEMKSEIRPTLGLGQTTIRRIASGTTDINGFYSLKFGLQKREFGQMADAIVTIHFTYDRSRFVPVRWYEDFGSQESLGPLQKRIR